MSETPSATPASPFEAQREIHELLSQETRHHILQAILGHPTHLLSLTELGYYIQKSESAILDQLDVLNNQDLIAVYIAEENKSKRDQPSKFYGLTERGIEVLDEFKYLRGVPVLRAVHDNTVKPERIQRHEDAPRPELPDVVANALEFDEEAVDADELEDTARQSIFADRATDEEAGAFDDLFL
ncbi:helix-turn-helix domain-containing protein [Halococcus agarilyticus]|uniref:hypothetical protein n=1 Tax=Halococcus agarilyticus TaxID=1232219 RepID=UPI000677998C|nr:hypothetical protein [Halococcus agarilyticus]